MAQGHCVEQQLVMIAGAILGASFLYNLFEAVRDGGLARQAGQLMYS